MVILFIGMAFIICALIGDYCDSKKLNKIR